LERFVFCSGVLRTPCGEQTLSNWLFKNKPLENSYFQKSTFSSASALRSKGLNGGPGGIRTRGNRLRRPAPYPLGHGPFGTVLRGDKINLAVVEMLLPDWKIKKEILIEPFSKGSLQPGGYDLRVGKEAYINGELIDVEKEGRIMIPPKTYALALTLERVKLPDDVMGDMKIRSSLAREGLLGSFAWVDPGWDGNLTLMLFNTSNEPVELGYGERFVQIAFIRLEGPARNPYRGNYQGSTRIALSKRRRNNGR
jgi:dCTP deaminase